MNALFALALLVSPSQAAVVMPVESGVAPSGPSAIIMPSVSPVGGVIGLPSPGADLGLRGGLPMLPAPVPGLVGPALSFVGESFQAAAVQPEAGAAAAQAMPVAAHPAQPFDKTPALPAKPAPGASALTVSRDRELVGEALLNGRRLERAGVDKTAASPLAGSDQISNQPHEKSASLGRRFFDRGEDKGRARLEGSSRTPSPAVAATTGTGGPSGPAGTAGGVVVSVSGLSVGPGHQSILTAEDAHSPEKNLRDAVASVPGSVPSAAVFSLFRSAVPNGELSTTPLAAAALVFPGAPRPLALDLSDAGLIVRVRSALSSALPAPSVAVSATLLPAVTPRPSTALLERGALLEAFSVAGAYAGAASVETAKIGRAARAPAPAPPSPLLATPFPGWWYLLFLPLIIAAARGIL